MKRIAIALVMGVVMGMGLAGSARAAEVAAEIVKKVYISRSEPISLEGRADLRKAFIIWLRACPAAHSFWWRVKEAHVYAYFSDEPHGAPMQDRMGVNLLILWDKDFGLPEGFTTEKDSASFFLGPAAAPLIAPENRASAKICGLQRPINAPELAFLRERVLLW